MQRLLLLRAMRPDRVTTAMAMFVAATLGARCRPPHPHPHPHPSYNPSPSPSPNPSPSPKQVHRALALALSRYIEQPPFSMRETFEDSSAPTPLFFVLFPGVDPGAEIEKLGRQLGFTEEAGRYVSISMGQGQEAHAEACLERANPNPHPNPHSHPHPNPNPNPNPNP